MSGSTRSYEMARRLVKAGHEVHMISSYRAGDRLERNWKTERVEGIHVHWLTVPYSNELTYGKRIQAFIHFAWAAARKACQIGGDIVFATSTPLTIALPGVYASWRLRAPMVFEVRDLWPELPIAVGALNNSLLIMLAKWLERFAYRNSSHVVALSPGMADGITAAGYPAENISIIPNGADVDFFPADPDGGRQFLGQHPHLSKGSLVVYAGTLGIINGAGYLVDIADKMQHIDPSVSFLVVGDGKEHGLIKKRAVDFGVFGKNFWLLEPVTKKEMPAVLAAATVATSLFVDLPEMWNNSANKFFDALAAGKPVMINYRGWQATLLQEQGAGIVVPPDDPQEAATLLHLLLSDKQKLKDCQKAARQLAETRFNRDILAARLQAVLEQVRNNVPAS